MSIRLSSETLHASTVAIDGRAVLISGISGAGKSDLALRLIDRGFTLVADDQTIVQKRAERLVVSAPQTIRGKLEIRGLGIVDMPAVEGTLPRSPADPGALAELAEKHGLQSSLGRLGAALDWPADALG